MDAFTITMAGNMNGFWSSLKTLYTPKDFLLLIPMSLLILPYICKQSNQRSIDSALLTFSLGVVINLLACVEFQSEKLIRKINKEATTDISRIELNPFSEYAMGQLSGVTMPDYIKTLSVLHAFVYNIKDYLRISVLTPEVSFTAEENNILEKIVNKNNCSVDVKLGGCNLLIIILLESFESWVVDKHITPNIYNFIYNNDKVIYIKNIQSQIRGGTSSDGQFIVNTGLLPIQKGAVCFRYPYNQYPSISSLFDEAAGIFPHGLDVWNQKQMSDAYKIDVNYTTSASDKVVLEHVIDVAKKHDFVLAITSQTHTPFEATCDSSGFEVPMALSTHLRNYIKSINYLDEQIGLFFETIKNDTVLTSANIVLTSDHKIFSDDMRSIYKQELDDVHWTYSIDEPYCPLIIYSPMIETPIYDTTSYYYQMDIYPTLINMLKIEDYYWKGLGVNILDTCSENKRIISVDNAYQFSDKIIRTNYFENINRNK